MRIETPFITTEDTYFQNHVRYLYLGVTGEEQNDKSIQRFTYGNQPEFDFPKIHELTSVEEQSFLKSSRLGDVLDQAEKILRQKRRKNY